MWLRAINCFCSCMAFRFKPHLDKYKKPSLNRLAFLSQRRWKTNVRSTALLCVTVKHQVFFKQLSTMFSRLLEKKGKMRRSE